MKTATLSKDGRHGRAATAACSRRPRSRAPKGLLGRSSLAPGEGMLFRPAGSIHMFFMRFAIDVGLLRPRARRARRRHVTCGPGGWLARKGAKVVVELPVGGAAERASRRPARARYDRRVTAVAAFARAARRRVSRRDRARRGRPHRRGRPFPGGRHLGVARRSLAGRAAPPRLRGAGGTAGRRNHP